jgi:pullulanase
MVQALHQAGLRVGMDVVYNHTSASGQNDKSVLDRIVPGYYHRLDGNGASRLDLLREHCHREPDDGQADDRLGGDLGAHYRIDSFRFDLMGAPAARGDGAAAEGRRQGRRRPVHLIGEGWNFGEVANGARFVQASQLSLNGSGIATFSDRARDAVRGGGAVRQRTEPGARQGYINGLFYDDNGSGAGKTKT